jgi:nucleoside-diphosphate-sugar epimerase
MILVTGATGFLGAELVVQLLNTHQKIRCIKRENSVIPTKLVKYNTQIEWFNADILDLADLEDAFDEITMVYHCAALVTFRSDLKILMLNVNMEGTANVVNFCLDKKVKKLVHVSSVAALGEAKTNKLIDETCFWDGFETHNGYSVSKYRAEMEVWRGINEGLNAVIVNPSVIIGEDAGTKGSGSLFHSVKNGMDYYTQGSTGFVDVKDVATIMISLMDSDKIGERFIINAENISYKDLFTQSALALGVDIPKTEAKPWMLNIAWRFTALKNRLLGQKGGLNKSVAQSASKSSYYDNSKIKSLLSYQFIPIKNSITNIANSLKNA